MNSDTRAIKDWLKQHQISEVECLVPDMTGSARGKFIPAHQFLSRGEPRLPESIMIQSVTGEYSDEHWNYVEPTDADMILDIGPDTAATLAERLRQAGTIVWNGPVGVFEFESFARGTHVIAQAIADSTAFSIAGGGDTLAAIAKFGGFECAGRCTAWDCGSGVSAIF